MGPARRPHHGRADGFCTTETVRLQPVPVTMDMSELLPSDDHEIDGYTAALGEPAHSSRIIAITSGKGGVGKTNVTTNLGIALSMRGAKVCIFDADTSLANINILLGLTPEFTLQHFLEGEKSLDEIVLEGPRGVSIIPAASGISEYANLNSELRQKLLGALEQLEQRYDYLLIDTAAGVGENVLSFVQSAQYAVVVISPEPTSLTDAFALVKSLKQHDFDRPTYVLVNMVSNFHASMDIFKRFQAAVQKYLKTTVRYLGYITLDETVISSIHLQRPVILAEPGAPASRCFHTLADAIRKNFRFSGATNSLSGFWREQGSDDSDTDEAIESPPQYDAYGAEDIEPQATASAELEAPAEPETPAHETPASPLDSARHFIESGAANADEAREFLGALVEGFVHRFEEFPLDMRRSSYRVLELKNFPEAEIRGLISTLEYLYEKRLQRPVHDLEDTIIKLLADVHGDEQKILELRHQLESGFERQFGKKLFDARAVVNAQVRDGEFSHDGFTELVEELKHSYQEQFGKPYEDEKDHMLHDLHDIAMRMEEQENGLRSGLTRLSQWFNETVSAREELLDRMAAPGRQARSVPPDDEGNDSTP